MMAKMTRYRIDPPEEFSKIARAAYEAIECEIYAEGTQFAVEIDGDVDGRFDSLYEIENWLIKSVIDWLSDAITGPDAAGRGMVDLLEECLEDLIKGNL